MALSSWLKASYGSRPMAFLDTLFSTTLSSVPLYRDCPAEYIWLSPLCPYIVIALLNIFGLESLSLSKQKEDSSMEKKWWHGKVAYQIYPKSFCDSNGDGVGDIQGIISKLDYLKDLGVEIVWLSPCFKSPFVDQGYDISDYQDIDPIFGTMEDFDELLAKAKERGISIILDLVINHCSSEHEWFKKACADPNCEEAKYFFIKKSKDGKLPDNLRSYFGGSVWEKLPGHEDEDLYYLHYFAKQCGRSCQVTKMKTSTTCTTLPSSNQISTGITSLCARSSLT